MLKIGQINTCTVGRLSDIGAFLEGDDIWEDFLVPNKCLPENISVGDQLEVFIYFDSEGRIIGTTVKPIAQVGDFASLKVTAIEEFGIFLDWGIDKDLFVPHREQLFKMEVGHHYPVYIYLDNSGRPAASTRLQKFVNKKRPPYKSGDAVELLIYQETELGLKAIVDGEYSGIIYRDDTIHHLKLGQSLQGFIKTIRSDHKIDLSIRPMENKGPADLQDLILSELDSNNGFLPMNGKSPAETINRHFGVSRKMFKVALGALYKQRRLLITEDGIQKTKE